MSDGVFHVPPKAVEAAEDDRIEVMLLVAALCGLAAIVGLAIAGLSWEYSPAVPQTQTPMTAEDLSSYGV